MPQINLGTSGPDSIRIINCSIIGNIGYENVGGIAITNLVGGEQKCRIENNGIIQNRYGITQYGNDIGSIIRNNVIEDNDIQGDPMLGGSGLNFYGNQSNQAIVSGNKITGNLWGITTQIEAKPNFGEMENGINPGQNQIYENGHNDTIFDFYNNTPNDIMAENNYWGTMDTDSVEMHIFHQPDDPTLGFVDYLPLFDIYTGLNNKTRTSTEFITSIFPNPANEHLNVNIVTNIKSVRVQMIDGLGRLVFSQEYSENNLTIPVNDFEDGVYFLKVTQGNYCDIQKVIVH